MSLELNHPMTLEWSDHIQQVAEEFYEPVPVTLQNTKDLVHLVSKLTETVLDDLDPGRRFRRMTVCKRGCSVCCHARVAVSIPEMLVIGEAILKHPRREAIHQRAGALLSKGSACDLRVRARRGMMCPLNENGTCLIYADRPLECRSITSIDSTICREGEMRPYAPQFLLYKGAASGLSWGFARSVKREDWRATTLSEGVYAVLSDPKIMDDILEAKQNRFPTPPDLIESPPAFE